MLNSTNERRKSKNVMKKTREKKLMLTIHYCCDQLLCDLYVGWFLFPCAVILFRWFVSKFDQANSKYNAAHGLLFLH